MQLTLDFSPGLTARYRSLKQVCAHAVYGSRAGLSGVAAALDMSPSELSKRLSETDSPDNRPLRDTDIERIITETGDASPIYWLVERYLGDPKAKQMQALAAIPELVAQLTALAEQAGVAIPASRKR